MAEFRAACGSSRRKSTSCSSARNASASRRCASSIAEGGVPPALAARIASLEALNAALDIAELASRPPRERCRGRARLLRGRHPHRARLAACAASSSSPSTVPGRPLPAAACATAALRMQRRLTERVLARKDRGTRAGARQRLGGGRGRGPRALAAHTRGYARRRRERLRHAYGGRGVGAQARELKRPPHERQTCRPAGQADARPPRPEHLERRESVHRLDGRGPVRAGTARSGAVPGASCCARSSSIDIAFTSVLKRAIRTLWIMLDEMDRMWLPVERSWRLNERHYGALQGLNKAQTVAQARRGAGEDLAPQLRHSAAAARRG